MTLTRMRRPKLRAYRPSPFDELSDLERALLFDHELSPADKYLNINDIDVKALWTKHRDAVLAAWVKDRPGTRPSLWWRYDAPRWTPTGHRVGWYYVAELPEPRIRLSGVGVTSSEWYPAIVPRWPFGVPNSWHEIDETDPPRFESQAAYLKRHCLLLPGEEARLTNDDFAGEAIA